MDKLGIVFSSRVRSAALCVLALWILGFLAVNGTELIGSYLTGGGFDASVHDVLVIDVLAFWPYYLVAAVFLRSLAVRIALFHKLRRQIVVPEYTPPEVLSPAEAGLLIDNDFTFNEIAATLKDLELRGCITITEKSREINIALADTAAASSYEVAFLEALCPEGVFSTGTAGSGQLLLSAGTQLAESTRITLVAGGQLPENRQLHKIIRKLAGGFTWFAVGVQILLTYALVSAPHEVLSVGYPRYPMHLIEPLSELFIEIAILAIVMSGFRQRSLTDDQGLKNWRYMAGLKMFIEKVYKDRFYRDGRQMATDNELRTFYPYAIALGIETRFTERLRNLLIF